MTQDKKAPKLRFKGFTDDWEQHLLKDNVSFYGGQTYHPENIKPNETLVIRSSNIQNNSIISADNVYIDSKIVNVPNVNIDDIIVVVRNGSKRLIGKHAIVTTKMNNTIIGAFMTGVRSKNSSFINALFDSSLFTKEIHKNLGATINQITTGEFKKMKFYFPVTIEQDKIGKLISKLDQNLLTQQRKLDQLKLLKKGLLQKMFADEKSKVPEIRFKGFDGEWVQKKLGEVLSSFDYGLNAASKKYDGKNKYLRITDIDDITHKFKYDNLTSPKSNDIISNNFKLNTGDIVFARTGASVGKTYQYDINDGDVYFAGYLIRGKTLPQNNPSFIFDTTLLDKYKNFVRIMSIRSGQPGINAEEYKKYNIFIPKYTEQNKVANLLKKISDFEAIQQQKLTQLQQVKKFLLQNMFI